MQRQRLAGMLRTTVQHIEASEDGTYGKQLATLLERYAIYLRTLPYVQGRPLWSYRPLKLARRARKEQS